MHRIPPPPALPLHLLLKLLLCSLLATAGWSAAQAGLSEAARQELMTAQRLASEALLTYDRHFLDRPLWRDALAAGNRAAELAPDRPEPQRFLGQAYTTVGFYDRAWQAWERYLALGGADTPQVRARRLESALWLGVNLYGRGELEGAVPYLEAAVDLAGSDADSERQRLADAYLELGRTDAAIAQLEPIADRDPVAAQTLELARDQRSYGAEAARAYQEGAELAAQGQLEAALERLRVAATAPDYLRAQRAAAQVATALERPEEAIPFWRQVAALDPTDITASQQLQLAITQERWGAEAYAAYRSGVDAATAGNAAAATTALERAISLNPNYPDPYALLGRLALERGDATEAAERLQRAIALGNDDASVRQLLERADAQLAAEAAAEQAAAEQAAAEQAAAEQAAAEQAAAEQTAAEQAAAEAARAAEQAAAERAAAEQAAVEQAAAEQAAAEQAAAEQAAAEQAAAAAAAAAAPQPSATDSQLELLDITLTHASAESGGRGAFTFVQGPTALRDGAISGSYAEGVLHLRAQVLGKPSDAPVQAQLCLVPEDIAVRPVCSDPTRLSFSSPGEYTIQQSLSSLDGYADVNWRGGIQNLLIVLTDENQQPLDSRYLVGEDVTIDPERYYPMEVHYQALLVPSGRQFSGWP